jgi:hypothetical protein
MVIATQKPARPSEANSKVRQSFVATFPPICQANQMPMTKTLKPITACVLGAEVEFPIMLEL